MSDRRYSEAVLSIMMDTVMMICCGLTLFFRLKMRVLMWLGENCTIELMREHKFECVITRESLEGAV